jgi:iron complex transport system substrate-binding protein
VSGEAIEVPADPQRIVAIHDSNGGEQVLSLGVELVGFPTRGGSFDPQIARVYDLDGVVEVGEVYQPNVEAIAALRPDLIVGEGSDGAGMDQFMGDGVQERLEAIAPVVYIDTFRSVEEVMADYGELLGPEAEVEVERQAADFAESVEEVRAALGDTGGLTASVVQMKAGDQLDVYGAEDLVPSAVLTMLDVAQPPVSAEADAAGGYLSISLERTREIDADLILFERGDDAADGEFGADHTGNTLWRRLAAVRAGQVYEWDSSWFGTTFHRYDLVLDALGPELVAADRSVVP